MLMSMEIQLTMRILVGSADPQVAGYLTLRNALGKAAVLKEMQVLLAGKAVSLEKKYSSIQQL